MLWSTVSTPVSFTKLYNPKEHVAGKVMLA